MALTKKQLDQVKKKEAEEQAKMNIYTDFPMGRTNKAIGKRKKVVSGGRGKMLKQRSKTGKLTGGGF